MDRANRALELFEKNNCAQAVFASCCDLTGLDETTALALASGFGGGIACGEACGAVCGLAMALGKILYDENAAGPEAKAKLRSIVKSCTDSFSAEFGAIACRDLMRNAGGKSKCPQFVQFCAKLVGEKAAENGK